MNVNISNVEEQSINEILDKGLSELKCILKSSKMNSECNRSQTDHTYSIIDRNPNKITTTDTYSTQQAKKDHLKDLLHEIKVNRQHFTNCKENEPNQREIDTLQVHETNFNDMKNEANFLQSKIESLEMRLSRKDNHEIVKRNYSSENWDQRKSFYHRLNTSSPTSNIKSFSQVKANNESHRRRSLSQKAFEQKYSYTKHSSSNDSHSNSFSRYNKLDWKEKYESMKHSLDDLKEVLIKERQKVAELAKKHKKLVYKDCNYNELVKLNTSLMTKNEKLFTKLEDSQIIRQEQGKLIKSLQREVDVLRGNYDSMVGISSVISTYRQLKGESTECVNRVEEKKRRSQKKQMLRHSRSRSGPKGNGIKKPFK